ERRGEKRNPRVHLRKKPDAEERESEIAAAIAQENTMAPSANAGAQSGHTVENQSGKRAKHRSDRVRREVDRTGVARRQIHLRRFDGERNETRNTDRAGETSERAAAIAEQRQEETEWRVREHVDRDVESDESRALGGEQEVRR